jgi:hypothetical protein
MQFINKLAKRLVLSPLTVEISTLQRGTCSFSHWEDEVLREGILSVLNSILTLQERQGAGATGTVIKMMSDKGTFLVCHMRGEVKIRQINK